MNTATDFEIEDSRPVKAEKTPAKPVDMHPLTCDAKTSTAFTTNSSEKFEFLYFDIECIPDESRVELFSLPRLPEQRDETLADEMPAVEQFLAQDISTIKGRLFSLNPAHDWLAELSVAETQGKKRKGVQDAIKDARKEKNAFEDAIEARRKLLSVTPEFCRIVSISIWMDNGMDSSGRGKTMVVNRDGTELEIINWFWLCALKAKTIVGYNCLAYDLPVILYRSALLRVDATRMIELRKYGNPDVIDLYELLCGSRSLPKGFGSLDSQCNAAGIECKTETECKNGSQVYGCYQDGNYEAISEYNAIDVFKTKMLHRKFMGLFW